MSLRRSLAWAGVGLQLLVGAEARSEFLEFTPYRPLYPAMILDAGWESDAQDRVFDADGDRRSSALPQLSGRSRFPQQSLQMRLGWTFPMFEQEGLPFFSSRLHTARLSFRYRDLASRGAIAEFVEADSRLQDADGGLGDTTLEFGSYLSGSAGWREGQVGKLSSLLMVGLKIPTGIYDRDAPINAGSNHLSAQVKLGVHGEPWRGGFLDAGLGYRVHGRNEEPAFGALAPARSGDEALWDLQLAQRLRPGLYLAVFADGREGQANRYRDPRFTLDDSDSTLLADIVPAPGQYRDEGASARAAGLALRWFLTPRWAAALHYTHPLSGQSGEFDVDLLQRTPAGCTVGAAACVTVPAGSERVDGLEAARSYASDRIGLSFTWQFGQGDTWACSGCSD